MAKKKRDVTYLVSGDVDIRPSYEILRKSKRKIRYDVAVNNKAAVELKAGQSFVVIAHGNAAGTVEWFNSAQGYASPWLWVGMTKPPRGTHLYLYTCKAGKKLPPYLDRCEVLGHVDVVPMPVEGCRRTVLAYLKKVDRLIADPRIHPDDWAKALAQYVNRALVNESEKPTAGWVRMATMLMLRRSMGYVDS